MSISHAMLAELEQEAVSIRKVLERVPDGKADYKPHEKSMPMGRLAGHLAELAGWGVSTLVGDSFDFRPVDGPAFQPLAVRNGAEAVAAFDRGLAAMKEHLAKASDEHLMGNWSLLSGGHTIFTMPRVACLRSFVMNHMVHHRAQLALYLRMLDIPVPSMYGPSADEGSM